MKYVSKLVEIDAMRWNGHFSDHRYGSPTGYDAEQIVAWVNANGGEARYERQTFFHGARIAVRTINGWVFASPDHYIVMSDEWLERGGGVNQHVVVRDFYPCDPATFEQRWEPKS